MRLDLPFEFLDLRVGRPRHNRTGGDQRADNHGVV